MSALVWLRRDLRVHEHPALRAALEAHECVVPVFCLDERILCGRHASAARTQFLLECLADLERSLRDRGGGLVIRHGAPERELPALAEQLGAEALHFTEDITPFSRRRERGVRSALEAAGVEATGHAGLNVIDDVAAPRTQAGRPYTVFSAFQRSWEREGRREVLGAPARLPPLPPRAATGGVPALASLGLEKEVPEPAPGGERRGRERLERFLTRAGSRGRESRETLGDDASSRLSPYLHFGCLSAREVEERLGGDERAVHLRRQLCWRDFYHHVLAHHPRNATSEFQARYRGAISWSHDEGAFAAWCEGRTGFPLVDAGMRQLRREGWMHNRVRLVVGSFLTKDLGIDWRWGERHFMRLLIDGDEANNNGNWQWIASVGTDPQPAYRRIYNPARQMQTHDPDGSYVRRYVAELKDVPDAYIREPWRMPQAVQREVGCVLGSDYPLPIVDHGQARRAALERYRVG